MSEPTPSSPAIDTIILMTTADMTGGREKDLQRLDRSIAAFKAKRPQVKVRHYMLLQRCEDAKGAKRALGFSEAMIVSAVSRQLPLSIARNQMLDTLLVDERDIGDALIAFPDDDAWFPEGSLEFICDSFGADSQLDFLFCRYGSDAELPQQPSIQPASLQRAISSASSNTMFLRGQLLHLIGGFDEGLGLGTPAKSGEDTEFAMRAFLASRKVRFVPHKIIGHRDFDRAIRAKYYAGTLVALGRHATRTPAAAAAFARKILVGVALMGKRDLPPAGLMQAWKMFASNRIAPNHAAASDRPSRINDYPAKPDHKDEVHA